MRFDIITIFPNLFDSFLKESLVAKAIKGGIIDIRVHNLRDWTNDRHRTVDDTPYGGGPGMILKFDPIARALKALLGKNKKQETINKSKLRTTHDALRTRVVMLDPAGRQFDQRMAERLSKLNRMVLLCGRYEGFDYRITKLVDERISVGPYILNGGEIPAMAVIEAVARLAPGFLGAPESLVEETFGRNIKYRISNIKSNPKSKTQKFFIGNFAEYPQYTRPEVIVWQGKKLCVPKVLLSGDHAAIRQWRAGHRYRVS